MKKNITDTKIEKEKIMLRLKRKHDMVIAESESNKYNERAYINLPLTLMERTFFDIVSKEVFNLDQTKMMRKFIHGLMVRHPDIVEKAKQRIDSL